MKLLLAFVLLGAVVGVSGLWADETKQIQSRIDAMAAAGGGRVSLPTGDHLVGSLLLKSGVELHLEKGARLLGSRNPDDYALDLSGHGYATNITKRWSRAMIRVIGAKDVAITGEPGSEICGRNCFDASGEEGFRGPHAITVFNSTNLLLRGYMVRDAGNYGFFARGCAKITAQNVEVRGGHDGFDFFFCEDVRVENCRIFSGDDCVAGFGNRRLTVRNCEVNSACSYFRLGGEDVLIEDCHGTAPAENPHRWSLSPEEKRMEMTPPSSGRRTTLSVFTFFTSKRVEETSRNIVFRNCRFTGVERLMHYNLSGSERWQQGRGLADVTFERVVVEKLSVPLVAYGVVESPLRLALNACRLSFREPVRELVRGAHMRELEFSDVVVEGVEGPILLNWKGAVPQLNLKNATGVQPQVRPATEKFICRTI